MRAAVLEAFSAPLQLREVPRPRLGYGEVLVAVRAVGLCGTDLKILSGAYPGTSLPIIPGHEVAGVVVEGPDDRRPGTRVACYIYQPCGRCRWCGTGQDTLCPNSRRIGFDRDGGLAGYVTVRSVDALEFAPSCDFALAATAMDAVTSVWRALHSRARVLPQEHVAVAGAGGLGLNAVQVARAAGARVAVIEPVPERREAALGLGAELAVAPDHAERIRDWSSGGVEVGLEVSGALEGFRKLGAVVRPGARIVCVGYRPGVEYGLDSHQLVRAEITVMGSRNGSREDARSALGAVVSGEIRPLIADRFGLSEVNDAVAMVRAGAAAGRVIVEPRTEEDGQ